MARPKQGSTSPVLPRKPVYTIPRQVFYRRVHCHPGHTDRWRCSPRCSAMPNPFPKRARDGGRERLGRELRITSPPRVAIRVESVVGSPGRAHRIAVSFSRTPCASTSGATTRCRAGPTMAGRSMPVSRATTSASHPLASLATTARRAGSSVATSVRTCAALSAPITPRSAPEGHLRPGIADYSRTWALLLTVTTVTGGLVSSLQSVNPT